MFRQQVLTEWTNLKETIKGHQQYLWGRLLSNLGIKSFAPHLSLELITKEIKDKLKDSEETHSLKREKWEWQEKFSVLKKEVNRPELKRPISVRYTGDPVADLKSELQAAQERIRSEKTKFEYLRNMINNLYRPQPDDDESGPTIEEVE